MTDLEQTKNSMKTLTLLLLLAASLPSVVEVPPVEPDMPTSYTPV